MAYSNENLSTMVNNMKAGVVPVVYFYYNEADDTVTGAGYFEDFRLNVGDIIQVLADDYTAMVFYRVSAVTDGKATVLALTTITP